MSTTNTRPNYRLYKWDHYPVKVYVSEFSNGEGLDFAVQARLADAAWNEAMWGEEYLVVEADSLAADIVIEFGYVGGGNNGVAILVEPSDEDYGLGDTIPAKVLIQINSTLAWEKAVQAKTLHELGHALGFAKHAYCDEAGYLMYLTTVGDFSGPLSDLIHLDERRAVRAIRNLPQGLNMAGFQPEDY